MVIAILNGEDNKLARIQPSAPTVLAGAGRGWTGTKTRTITIVPATARVRYTNSMSPKSIMTSNIPRSHRHNHKRVAFVCTSGTTTEANLADYFRSNGMRFEQIAYDTSPQTREGFEGGACDVLTSDKSQLAAIRSELANPSSAIVLPETISKEPLGPVVRQGDDEWFNLVKWTLFAIINAEEMGVSSANVDQMRNSEDPGIKRLLGSEGELCQLVSERLNKACFAQAIKQVGNYGEIYEANVGENTPLGLIRAGSPNDLWSRPGGLLYAPPIR